MLCSLRAVQTLVGGHFSDVSQPEARSAVLFDYVHFLTTPRTHNDTYAESFHRSFFADWQETRPTFPPQVKLAPPGGTVASWLSVSLFLTSCVLSGPGVRRKTLQAEVELPVHRRPAGRHRMPSHDPPFCFAVCLSQ